jgi:hypothetical protein
MPEQYSRTTKVLSSSLKLSTSQLRPLFRAVGVLMVVLICPFAAMAQNAGNPTMSWPDATAQLIQFKTTSETCISIIKQFGNTAQKAHARLDYGEAEARANAIVSGLEIALYNSGDMKDLQALQTDLTFISTEVVQSCGIASGMIPADPGHKGVADDIAKAAIEPLIKAVSDGISALYKNHRADKDLIKKTIQTQLEAAKWQDFDKVTAGQ